MKEEIMQVNSNVSFGMAYKENNLSAGVGPKVEEKLKNEGIPILKEIAKKHPKLDVELLGFDSKSKKNGFKIRVGKTWPEGLLAKIKKFTIEGPRQTVEKNYCWSSKSSPNQDMFSPEHIEKDTLESISKLKPFCS